MKKNISFFIKAFVIALVATTVYSCTDGFDNINEDPYGVTKDEAERDAYSQGASMVAIQAWVVPTFPNAAQFTELLLGGSWSGYFADSNPGFNGKNFAQYRPEPGWNRVMFNDIIPNIFPYLSALEAITDDEVLLSVAEISKVAGVHRVTDTYGPIPYTEIGVDGELQAPFDSQEKIYKTMIQELTDAIDILTTHKTESFSANADKVYGGNVLNWIKFANSLKLRLAMRMVYADEAAAKQSAEEAANHEIGTMESNADNAFISGFGRDGNPLHRVMHLWNGGDSRVGADITSFMNGFDDPRREKYFTETTFTEEDNVDSNGYFGLRSGINIPAAKTAQKYTNYKVSPSSPLMWMNAAEVAFLKAEGQLRGWNMGSSSAQEFYEEGIKLSFGQWNAENVDDYLANSSDTPKSYKDPLGQNSYSGATSEVTIAWDNSAEFEFNLEQIITQKWIANFPLGIESWAEYRRTGYPKLMPVVVNNSGGVVSSQEGPNRLAYPAEEISTNGPNVQQAISDYLKGPDNMATHVWWDKKNK